MPNQLSGKRALVTGASRGIGAAMAAALSAEGARVAVHYSSSKPAAEALANKLNTVTIQAELSLPDEPARLYRATEAALNGPLDILINNAAVANLKPLTETTPEEFEMSFALNTRAPFLLAREAALRMADAGRIINISSGATVGAGAIGALYRGSKGAIEQLTMSLARELGPRQITVNTVSPGFTDTDMFRQFPHLVAIAESMAALGRVGTTKDIADVVVWLCSEQARWVTGQNIQAGGGASMV